MANCLEGLFAPTVGVPVMRSPSSFLSLGSSGSGGRTPGQSDLPETCLPKRSTSFEGALEAEAEACSPSPSNPSGSSGGGFAALAGVTDGVATSDMSSQLSKTSVSLGFSGLAACSMPAAVTAASLATGPPEASATMDAFTVHTPSRSSTK